MNKDTKKDIQIYSGVCCLCDIGRPTNETDLNGNGICVGDIVQLWHGEWVGTDDEQWLPSDGLTAVVSRQYQSYSNGKVEATGDIEPFTMGIANVGVQGGEWRVKIVKSHSEIIAGERFHSYGLNYKLATPEVIAARESATHT